MNELKKEKTLAQYDKMTKTPVARLVLILGVPTTVSMLITNIYNMADSYFVSKIDLSAGGATGVGDLLPAKRADLYSALRDSDPTSWYRGYPMVTARGVFCLGVGVLAHAVDIPQKAPTRRGRAAIVYFEKIQIRRVIL